MSDHVLDRLSVYLDGELVAAEAQEVAAHLAQCAACARSLEELAAVDHAARALPVEPPAGYFEAFPARLRARIAPRRVRAGWRVPAWTLAAAAVLALAVITPRTLREMQAPPAASAPAAAPLAAADHDAGRVPPATTVADDKRLREELRALGYVAPEPKAPAKARPAPVPERPKRDVPTRGVVGGVVGGLPEQVEGRMQSDAPRVPAPEAAFAAAPPAQAESAEAQSAIAPQREATAKESRVRREAAADAVAALEKKKEGPAAAAAPAEAPAPAYADERFRGLLNQSPRSASEARALRESWRTYAAIAPATLADEARVQVILAGAEAYRLSGAEEDRTPLRRDAAAYLARPDARQRERVRDLLASLGL